MAGMIHSLEDKNTAGWCSMQQVWEGGEILYAAVVSKNRSLRPVIETLKIKYK